MPWIPGYLFSLILGTLIAIPSEVVFAQAAPQQGATPPAGSLESGFPAAAEPPMPVTVRRRNGRWVAVRWAELPGFQEDSTSDAWNAWVLSCERPPVAFVPHCGDIRRLSIGSELEQRAWMVRQLQPYRVESAQGSPDGLLTGYFEPVLEASRQFSASFPVPLYRPPANLPRNAPWFSRQEIDTLPEARAALQGRELAWLASPIDALILHIQGSGRLRIAEADGSTQVVRFSFTATNNHPYRSVGRWLLDQGQIREASWGAIKAWAMQNPRQLNEMLWSNPRVVFFREEAISGINTVRGPRGAQGVELTPGRSIAVDRDSIPYGTPVWMVSQGTGLSLRRLVLAQDTGSAIVGAVRADYFTGWGEEAQELAGRIKHGLQLWVLWPKGTMPP